MATDEILWPDGTRTSVKRVDPIDTKPVGSPLLSGHVRVVRMWHGGPTEFDETPMNNAVYCRLCFDLYVTPVPGYWKCSRESCNGALHQCRPEHEEVIVAAYRLGGWNAVRDLALGCLAQSHRAAMKYIPKETIGEDR